MTSDILWAPKYNKVVLMIWVNKNPGHKNSTARNVYYSMLYVLGESVVGKPTNILKTHVMILGHDNYLMVLSRREGVLSPRWAITRI